jgi:hypothetical protein
MKILGMVVASLAVVCSPVWAANVELCWEYPHEFEGLAGYVVYWGDTARKTDAPNLTNRPEYPSKAVIPNPETKCHMLKLTPGTWFASVTAFGKNAAESLYSNEIKYVLPAMPPAPSNLHMRFMFEISK